MLIRSLVAAACIGGSVLAPASWGQAANPAGPPVVITPRWRVLAAYAPTLPELASDVNLANVLGACRQELPAGLERLAFATGTNAWRGLDSITASKPLVALSIAPNRGAGAACGDTIVAKPVAVARGLDFVAIPFELNRSPAAAVARVGGKVVQSVHQGRAPVLRIRSGTAEVDSTQQLRLYIPLEALAPDSSGRFARTEIVVTTAGTTVDTVVLASDVLAALWAQALPWRLQQLGASSLAAGALVIPIPSDSLVVRSAEALRSGDFLAAARLATPGLSSPDAEVRRYARVLIGATLWGVGDPVAGRVFLGQALAAEPCLAAAAHVNSIVRRATSEMRLGAPCSTRSSAGVFARGLAFPGFGQRTTGRRSLPVALTTASLFAVSGAAARRSASDYERYKSATQPGEAVTLYDAAARYRMLATRAAVTGTVLWAGSAIEAAWRQSRVNRRIRASSNYGAAR